MVEKVLGKGGSIRKRNTILSAPAVIEVKTKTIKTIAGG
jgi:hypothetical protein